jgi:hypothetical protein
MPPESARRINEGFALISMDLIAKTVQAVLHHGDAALQPAGLPTLG